MVEVYPEMYTPVPVGELEDKLNNPNNLTTIDNGQHFYIGAASAYATPIQSMCKRENANKKHTTSNHDADEKAEEDGLRLTKVFYADTLISRYDVCAIEMKLIHICICQYAELCRNNQRGKSNCITGDTGIVYLRIYKDKKRPREQDDVTVPGKRHKPVLGSLQAFSVAAAMLSNSLSTVLCVLTVLCCHSELN